MLFEVWLFLEINWIVYIKRCCFIKLDIWEQSVYTARHNLVYWGLSMKKIIMCLVGLPVCQDPIFFYSWKLTAGQRNPRWFFKSVGNCKSFPQKLHLFLPPGWSCVIFANIDDTIDLLQIYKIAEFYKGMKVNVK